MIIREKPSAFRLFFVLRGSLILKIWPQMLGVTAISAAVVAAHRLFPQQVPVLDPSPFALIGIALSIFLSFRNSSCYDRWWEARRLWGQMLQTARDIARQTAGLEQEQRRPLLHDVIDFAHAAVAQLRGLAEDRRNGLVGRRLLAPDAILTQVQMRIGALLRTRDLEPVEALALTEAVTRLGQALVGCERLANTPLPFAYTLLLHRTAYLFCFLLPFGFANSLGWFTPLATAIVAYTFFGIDALGEELEEPFGLMPNNLPIATYATGIEITLKQALGERDLPDMPVAEGFILT